MDKVASLIAEANDIIEKRAGKPTPKVATGSEDETVKLAQLLLSDNPVDAAAVSQPVVEIAIEKVAHAIAIVETVLNLEQFAKLAAFEKQAKEKGFTDEQIGEFIEKRADKWKNIAQYVGIPSVAAAGVIGHHLGKKKGYAKALTDVNDAFSVMNTPEAQ